MAYAPEFAGKEQTCSSLELLLDTLYYEYSPLGPSYVERSTLYTREYRASGPANPAGVTEDTLSEQGFPKDSPSPPATKLESLLGLPIGILEVRKTDLCFTCIWEGRVRFGTA